MGGKLCFDYSKTKKHDHCLTAAEFSQAFNLSSLNTVWNHLKVQRPSVPLANPQRTTLWVVRHSSNIYNQATTYVLLIEQNGSLGNSATAHREILNP